MPVNPLIRSTHGSVQVHGDEVDIPMMRNPHDDDQNDQREYENGYEKAQQIGHMALGAARPEEIARWQGSPPAWREGFETATTRLGLQNVANQIEPQKQAFWATEYIKKAESRDYRFEGRPEHLKKIDNLFGWIRRVGRIGHSGSAEIFVDGDGAGQLNISRLDGKELPKIEPEPPSRGPELRIGID